MIDIRKTPEFENWYEGLRTREQLQIDARLMRVEKEGHFGDAKYLGQGLAEMRWKNGWRIYFSKESSTTILLLLGGIKNAQTKDIQRARILLRRYAERID